MGSEKGANLLQTYRETAKVFSKTSRLSNKLWYGLAQEMPIQWHISIDRLGIVGALWSSQDGSWSSGPPVDRDGLMSPSDDRFQAWIEETQCSVLQKKSRALGVVIHLHDNFHLHEIKDEFVGEGVDFLELDELLRLAPESALSADFSQSGDRRLFCALPYWGALPTGRRAVALQATPSFEAFAAGLVAFGEKLDIPVKVAVTIAPLEVLRLYRNFDGGSEASHQTGKIIIVRSVDSFLLAVYSESHQLRCVKQVASAGEGGLPLHFGKILLNLAASQELDSPSFEFIDVTRGTVAPIDLGSVTEVSCRELVYPEGNDVPLEFLNRLNNDLEGDGSHDDSALIDSWPDRSLYSLACDDPNLVPSQAVLKSLMFSRILRLLVVLAVPIIVGFCAVTAIKNSFQDHWKVGKSDEMESVAEHEKLTIEKKQIIYLSSLLDSRAEGWVPLTALLDLFPESSGILISSFDVEYFSVPASKRAKTLPMRQTWRIKGHATREGLRHLVSLGAKAKIEKVFEEISEWSESESYRTSVETRSLNVVLQQKKEAMVGNSHIPTSHAESYDKGFEIMITRDFSEKDPVSLVIKVPRTGGGA